MLIGGATVDLEQENQRLRAQTHELRGSRGRLPIDVTDDGCGGASADGGSGPRGLADRVGALDGRVAIDSSPGDGTCVRVEIPVLPRPGASPPLRSRSALPTPCRRFLRGG